MTEAFFAATAGVTALTVLAVFGILVALAILWFFLPFSVFGIKPIMRDILSTQRNILYLLQQQNINGPNKTPPAGIPAKKTTSNSTEIVICAGCGRETYAGQDNCPHCHQPLRVAPG